MADRRPGGRGNSGDSRQGGGSGGGQGRGQRGRPGEFRGGQGGHGGSSSGMGYQRGGHQDMRGSGSGFPGERGMGRGRGSALTWSKDPMPVNQPPICVTSKWNHDGPLPQSASDIKELMPRFKTPGTRSIREKVLIDTNFFLTKITLPNELHRYEVTVTKVRPPTKAPTKGKGKGKEAAGGQGAGGPAGERTPGAVPRELIKRVLEALQLKLRDENPNIAIIHDGSRILFTNKILPTSGLGPHSILHSCLRDEDDSNVSYDVTLALAGFNVDMDRAQYLIDNLYLDHPELAEVKQFLNILMKNIGGDQFLPYGKSSLMQRASLNRFNDLGSGLMNWKGVSVICTIGSTWKPFVNIDIQNSAFLVGQDVLEAIATILDDLPHYSKTENVGLWTPKDFRSVNDILKSCKIRRKVNNQNRDQTITGFEKRPAAELYFPIGDRQISVAQHFKNNGAQLKYPNAVVLQLGKAKVPAELCKIKEAQSYNRLLPSKSTTKMVKYASSKQNEKHADIMRAVEDLNLVNNSLLGNFGVSCVGNMLEKQGTRVLPPPNLCYGKEIGNMDIERRGIITPSNGVWDMWNHRLEFFRPVTVNSWAILSVGVDVGDARHQEFVSVLKREATARGIKLPAPTMTDSLRLSFGGGHSDNVNSLVTTLTKIKSKLPGKNCFIFCIIPEKRSVFYSQVKQAAEREGNAGVLTQCIVVDNYLKANHAVIKNLLLKINAKLGGTNHVPIIPEPDFAKINFMKIPTLVIGMDVTHPPVPTKGSSVGQPSFAAVTGSIDRSAMPNMMHIQAQMRSDNDRILGAAEVVQNLDVIITSMLKTFYTKTGHKPLKIIVYRDGVGESQFPEILQIEMQAIRKACTGLGSEYKPSITIIAVQKRHKVRFFLKHMDGQISKDNVPPGTVVDTDIVQPSDFYLVSHYGALGTSRPTHYHVLWDDSDFSADEIQGLTYFLCYMYSRCNRSVSYPAPTYYAHWAALRASNLSIGYEDWDGTEESLRNLNRTIERSTHIKAGFPMHFI